MRTACCTEADTGYMPCTLHAVYGGNADAGFHDGASSTYKS